MNYVFASIVAVAVGAQAWLIASELEILFRLSFSTILAYTVWETWAHSWRRH